MSKQDPNHQNHFSTPPQSYWISSTESTSYPSLQEDIQVDVAIIGGGMAGITSGFLLKKSGVKVAILEVDRILNGTTGHTTAKITSQHNLIYDKLIKQFGKEKAQQYAESNERAIELISTLVEEEKIDCDFIRKPAFIYTQQDQYVQKIINEAKAAISLGINAEYTDKNPLPFPIKGALVFRDQAQFHPRKYLLTLAEKIPGDGSHIFEETKVIAIDEGNPSTAMTKNGRKVIADRIIIASHYPFYDGLGFYFARMYAERSYVVAFKGKEPLPEGMFINAEQPVRSLRSQPFEGGELILAGGESHKVGEDKEKDMNERYKRLVEFSKEVFNPEKILYRWSTQDCMTLDNVPYIGPLSPGNSRIYVATGFKKWGMTSSTVSAMLLKDLIVKGESPWADVYNPSRFNPTASFSNFLSHGTTIVKSFVGEKLFPSSFDGKIKEGEGKVVTIKGKRVGAYRNEEGKLFLVDTTCKHLSCEVEWNSAEKTWDCPCHGSRYSYEGKVWEGPTTEPLDRLED